MFNVRANLRDEFSKISAHLSTVGITRLGLVYEDGPDASALIASAQESIQKNGGALFGKGSYAPGSLRMDVATKAMQDAKPQAIILVTGGAAAAAFIERYRLEGGSARIFASSDVDLEQMSRRLAEENMQGISIAQVTPNPYRIASKLSKEFREVQANFGEKDVPVSYAMMEGYIAAKIIVEAVRRTGSKPTKENIITALETIDGFDLGGYTVGYRTNRTGSRFVELSIISSAGRIRQ